jgi:hypothetical protein
LKWLKNLYSVTVSAKGGKLKSLELSSVTIGANGGEFKKWNGIAMA